MVVQFKYKLPEGIIPLVRQDIDGFNDDYILGWFDQMDIGQLHHCSLYMICELETIDNNNILSNPLAVVGKNTVQAMETYVKATGNKNGTVLCEIVNDCSSIKVESTGVSK